ncbi:MAG: 23S rRNA (pseudouridine(1915)-N(3))-methyltransferase RlmH [Bacteroidota bacterium]
MNIAIIVVGKTAPEWVATGFKDYLKRLAHYSTIDLRIVPPAGNLPATQAMEKEGVSILSKIGSRDRMILLDEHGEGMSSVQFAGFIEKAQLNSVSSLVFVTGGAYGVSKAVRERADKTVSFARFTFTHQMIRLLLAEQLYRAFTIIKGQKYHND